MEHALRLVRENDVSMSVDQKNLRNTLKCIRIELVSGSNLYESAGLVFHEEKKHTHAHTVTGRRRPDQGARIIEFAYCAPPVGKLIRRRGINRRPGRWVFLVFLGWLTVRPTNPLPRWGVTHDRSL